MANVDPQLPTFDGPLVEPVPGQSNVTAIPQHSASASSAALNSTASTTSIHSMSSNPATSVCSYYSKGSCLRLNCKYFHGTEEQLRKSLENRSNRTSNNPSQSQSTNSVPGDERNADLAAMLGGAQPNQQAGGNGKKPIVCLSYLSGSCHRPDCRFVHLPPTIRPLPNSVCTYFESGTCRRTHCRYFHGPEAKLRELQGRGVTMYNPLNNEPYDQVPDFLEPPNAAPAQGPPPPFQQAAQPVMLPVQQPPQQVVYLVQQPNGQAVPMAAGNVMPQLVPQMQGALPIQQLPPGTQPVFQQMPAHHQLPPQVAMQQQQQQPVMLPMGQVGKDTQGQYTAAQTVNVPAQQANPPFMAM